MQTTALLNEAYLRLMNQNEVEWRDRAHFFGIAARNKQHVIDVGQTPAADPLVGLLGR